MKPCLIFYSDLNIELFTDLKLEKLLKNQSYRDKFGWDGFPDKEFSNLWKKFITLKNMNKNSLTPIFNYLQNKTISFNEKTTK